MISLQMVQKQEIEIAVEVYSENREGKKYHCDDSGGRRRSTLAAGGYKILADIKLMKNRRSVMCFRWRGPGEAGRIGAERGEDREWGVLWHRSP